MFSSLLAYRDDALRFSDVPRSGKPNADAIETVPNQAVTSHGEAQRCRVLAYGGQRGSHDRFSG